MFKKLISECTLKKYQTDSTIRYERPRFSWTGELPLEYQDSLQMYEKRGWVMKMDMQILANDIYEEGDYAAVEEIVEQQKDSSVIRIVLSPNPVLRSINILGNSIFPVDTLLSIFRPLYGQHLNAKRITLAFEHLLALYRTSGYPLARVLDVRFDSTSNSVNIV